jgi:hypothetical protein
MTSKYMRACDELLIIYVRQQVAGRLKLLLEALKKQSGF